MANSARTLYFSVLSFNYGDFGGFYDVVEPLGNDIDASEYAGRFRYRNLFSQRPHLVGTEGDCKHLSSSAILPWSQILTVAAKQSNGLSIGPDLSSMEPCLSSYSDSGEDTWLPGQLDLVSASYNYSLYNSGYSKHSEGDDYFEEQGYYIGTTAYAYKAHSRDAEGVRNDKTANASLVSLKGRYAIHTHIYHKVRNDLSEYKYCTADEGYVKKGRYKIKNRTDIIDNLSCTTWFFGIDLKLLEEISQSCRFCIGDDLLGVGLPKHVQMPVEESLLDDIYNLLDRAEMNLAATLIEVCGSLRNAKNLSSVCSKIRKAGGIRKLLKSEASYLLKDKKLKTASDLYLTKKYVFDTTNMDIDDLSHKLSSRMRRSANPVQHFSYSNYDEKLHASTKHCIRISYKPPEQSWCALNGFDLPLEATWDLLPWSFVVDWFTGIGDYIASVEKLDAIQEIDINCVTESMKYEAMSIRSVDVMDTTIQYTCVQKYYCRMVGTKLPPIYPQSPELSNPFHHIIDGAALIFSKGK